MLERLKQLRSAEAWAEIIQLAPALPGDLTGDDLAKAYLRVSTAYSASATTAGEYRAALGYARQAVTSAQPGGTMHAWALARVAAFSADMGMYPQAEAAAQGFRRLLEMNPGAGPMEPYALYALARALSRQGHHGEAVALLRTTLISLPVGEFRERVTITLARALARAGRSREALAALPESVGHLSDDKLHSALSLIYARAGRWVDAEAEGRLALRSIGSQPIFDVVEAAELLLTLKQAADALGHHRQAAVWLVHTAAILSRWGAVALIGTLSTPRKEGGVYVDEAVSRCGSVGHKRAGLCGTVG